MKKIYLITTILFLLCYQTAFADDDFSSSGVEDLLKYTNSVENGFAGQKQINDEQFQKTLDEVKAKKAKKDKSNRPFKGQDLNSKNEGELVTDVADKTIILSVPLCLINGDGTEIPVGHYKIVGEKINNNVYIDFYQSATKIAQVPAIETSSDFDQSAINFVQLIPYNEERIKVIFGSLDFNAYTFIKIKDKITD